MGPSKRKGSVRRPVLDLNTREDSPSRPTWQNKYQHVLLADSAQENGDSHTPSPQTNNPLSGLLGSYNSDSDSEESAPKSNSALDAKVEDFLKEIHSISAETPSNVQENSTATQAQSKEAQEVLYPSSVTAWQQCYDHNSGYPYYWNTETNEVTWEMPTDLKVALTNVAIKQQEQQQQQQQQKQNAKITHQEAQPITETKKKICKYPWQTESDSEDEKIEMITSFGPQSGEESEEEDKKIKKHEKTKKTKKKVAPQCSLGPSALSLDPAKIRSDSISLAPDDADVLNESAYGTSPLLTHGVQDTGPPGDENFQNSLPLNKSINTKKDLSTFSQTRNNTLGCNLSNPRTTNKSNVQETCLRIESDMSDKDNKKLIKEDISEKSTNKCSIIADDIIAQIEKETPPDYKALQKFESQDSTLSIPKTSNVPTTKPPSIALIANYGDDSESEDISASDKSKCSPLTKNSVKSVFPIEIPQEKDETPRPLFPCVDAEIPKINTEPQAKECVQEESEPLNNIYNSDIDISDLSSHKAFKRKKRLEFATTLYCPSTSKTTDTKSNSPEQAVSAPSTQYNMDPTMNEHRGFGFSCVKMETGSQRKTYKSAGGIQFVKAETLLPSCATEPKEKDEDQAISISAQGNTVMAEPVLNEKIEDAASLLREKVTFLTGGKNEISPIQCMAIELETLVLAWQQGALTPSYLLRWLNEKCADLICHEKTAAPSGWTCLWDRKNKRYYYRNTATKATQLEYPSVEDKIKPKDDVVGGGDEMDICDTPPHMSPVDTEKPQDVRPSTPSASIVSSVLGGSSNSSVPQPPPPPVISFSAESDTTANKPTKKRKRKANEISHAVEGGVEGNTTSNISGPYEQTSENAEPAPPLPPMPPPPPPPPDEPPPPLIDSPPPLSLDPDQPLPPGVDEPEYAHYRRVSPKHSYKKTQADSSSAYSAELMMTFGYGLPVQQVVSSTTQPITMQMQPLEYHTYMHEAVPNTYLVQPSSTSHVIQCSAKKPKVSLNSELMSFYSDLAMLENPLTENSSNVESQASSTPEPVQDSVTTSVVTPPTSLPSKPVTAVSSTTSLTSATTRATESTTSNGVNVKKKKKAKATSGLALKKKGVSRLVAKWQQVQQEVRRDFSDDDNDDNNDDNNDITSVK